MENIAKCETGSSKTGDKRKRENLEPPQESTPTRNSQRPDGHFATPVKRRLDFNFWEDDQDEEESVVEITNMTKISDLHVGEWKNDVIRFRVTFKSEVKDTVAGKIYSYHVLDDSREIAIVNFRYEEDQYDFIKINRVYKLQNFTVKEENENYPSGSENLLQIILKKDSIVTKEEDESGIPGIPTNFKRIQEIREYEVKKQADLIGVITFVWEMERTRNGKVKRDIAITDMSEDKKKSNITVTLWGRKAENFGSEHLFSVVVMRKAVVSTFDGKTSLNCNYDTLFWVDPNLAEAEDVRTWFDNVTAKKYAGPTVCRK